jgi:hypothetical protein
MPYFKISCNIIVPSQLVLQEVFFFRFTRQNPFNIWEIWVEITVENIMTQNKENDTVNEQLQTMRMATGVSYYPSICPVELRTNLYEPLSC